MSDGINPSDLYEAPQRTDEIKETAEVQPEVQEAAVSLEKATLKPEEKVEAEMEISKDAEDLEAALKTTMEVVTEVNDRGPTTEDRAVEFNSAGRRCGGNPSPTRSSRPGLSHVPSRSAWCWGFGKFD